MSCSEEPDQDVDFASAYELCYCGDTRDEHDPITGKSLYNFECEGFQYDEDATILALATMKDFEL